MSDGFLKTK